ncbi:MAG TPA: M4 family metallopeptidase [Bacteroidota bacterium]|nr:M4 family metallopeptidase [Bacteroidota bacterium]
MARRIPIPVFIALAALFTIASTSGAPKGLHSPKTPRLPSANIAAAVAALRTPPAMIMQHMNAAAAIVPDAGASPTLAPILQGKQLPLSTVAPTAEVVWNESSGTPRVIRVHYPASTNVPSLQAVPDPLSSAQQFFSANKTLLRIADPASEFTVISTRKDNDGTSHIRFQQRYGGIEVWANDAYVHEGKDGRVVSFNGTFHPTPVGVNTSTAIAFTAAVRAVEQDLAARNDVPSIPASLTNLLGSTEPKVREVIWFDQADLPHLVWFVEKRTALDRDWYYFVDAQSGAILHSYNNVPTDGPTSASANDLNGVQRTFGTYLSSSEYYMVDAGEPMYNGTTSQIPQNPVGAIVGLDLRGTDLNAQSTIYFVTSTNNSWTDPASVSAQYNATVVYNFYRNVFGRNSIDDSGMTIYSIIHVTQNGNPMDNAYWSGSVMCYGDGNTYFKPLAGGFDVAAHEMTHGVTQHTANLIYQNQSGALNESMSDVFAAVVDSANWTIGEQIIKDLSTFPSGALRDLSSPHNGGTAGSAAWQPANMAEFVSTTQDNGGVHVNSGIPNNAFYRVAVVTGRPRASAIWYKALTSYLTSAAQFVDARIATESAASQLYGSGSPELTAVQNAWDAVGVTEGSATQPPPSSHLVGTNWVLAVNTASSDPNSVYMIRPVIQSNSDFFPLTSTPVLTRPAVSDTSGVVVFVDRAHRLRAMIANAQNPQESYIDTNSVWRTVAIGPGLTSLALTSEFIDTTVYYVDFVHQTSTAFKIRATAYDGTPVATALYSDALSFDPSGRYLLFDVYNRTKTAQGDSISFWTIDLLDVTTGSMQSVFPPQAEGIDIGNPSFSRSMGNRFVFDYWDETNQVGSVMGADFFTGKSGTLVGSLPDVGYPSLSSDGLTLAFHSLVSQGGVDHDVVQNVAVDSSGIAAAGSPTDYVVDATYPVWFTIGSRVTGVQEQQQAPASFVLEQNYPNPFNPTTTIRYTVEGTTGQGSGTRDVRISVYDLLGREVAVLVDGRQTAGEHEVRFDGGRLSSGVYFYELTSGASRLVHSMVLMK